MLYGTEYWAVKNQYENRVGITEMRMLCWMSGKTGRDKIRNDTRVGLAPIVKMMVENKLRWFGHFERIFVDVVVRKVDQMEESRIKRGRGRHKKTIRETIRKDVKVSELDPNMVLDRILWRNLIHIIDLTWCSFCT